MRVSSDPVFRDLKAALTRISEAQKRTSSGKRVLNPSDDPGGIADLVRVKSSLEAVHQHQRNIELAEVRLATQEDVLSQTSLVLARVQELAVAQGSDTANAQTRLTSKAEVDALLDNLVQLANTQINGEYLFGGSASLTQPLASDGTLTDPANPPAGGRTISIGPGVQVETTDGAVDLFLDSGVIDAVRNLSNALGADDVDGIKAAIPELNAADDEVQIRLGTTGARSARMSAAANTLESLDQTLTKVASDIEDVDLEEAISELMRHQSALQSALFATSQGASLSLLDFLR